MASSLKVVLRKKGKQDGTYSKVFQGDFGQARDVVILESSWLGSSEPAVLSHVNSFIYQMMAEKGQIDIAVEYGLLPFEVSILAPTRTLCEKIMSLVRFSYTEKPITDLRNKIRHVYDLHQLLGQDDIAAFFKSSSFDEMLHKVAQDDELAQPILAGTE
jgi:hypothetical protein